ncbi:hypothetical protein T10_3829 [Trichinella papuae]|uniref:Uncharacterized protein n=1 Tax=Trichinella papuae TaxID=268474 RepID=A0A0V1MVZ8_9BILA|nr:hypothetical protein T10_3829 [Trichinella papuae]
MEQRKSENADDTKQITDGTKQNKRRQEIIEPDPPSTDRSLRSAEDVASSPDGSFAP